MTSRFLGLNHCALMNDESSYSLLLQPLSQIHLYERGRPGLIKQLVFFFVVALFVLIIACINFMNLSTARATRRAKEVGVRKVLGASVSGIITLLCRDFTKWILLANIIAWPLAYIFMNRWLENFAYKINIEWWIYLLAGGIALLIALLTVSSQAVNTALANPVKSIRYE